MEQFYLNRKSDLEEENQFDISDIAKESGLLISIFVTSTIWTELIKPDEEAIKSGENETSRIKEILSHLVTSIRLARQTKRSNIINFKTQLTSDGKSRDYEIISYLGPINKDNNNPCITLLSNDDL
ncbi:MAG: hypothetical protein GTO02_22895 [Candidatus Dadabacteria bacterium]|nr:hypothetical protein [Candidatus Dadabacteria bacterium]NIQ17122.1 hypothetical protein [Candidatus Dadabacteria bacterium]